MYICQYCFSERKNINSLKNHELKCPSNPKRNYVSYTTGKTGWNKGLTKDTDERVKKYSSSLKTRYHNDLKPHGCAIWSTEQRSLEAKQQGFGGYRENAGRSKKFRVMDSYGKETVLQSSYELKCSEILNELGVKWIRPKALKYNGKNYYADFYLTEYGIYLDPKNSYKATLDYEKINAVQEQNNVKVYILLEEHLTTEYITGIL